MGNNNLKRKDMLNMKPEMADVADVSEDLSDPERRRAPDRRKRTLYSLFYGSFNPRSRITASSTPETTKVT